MAILKAKAGAGAPRTQSVNRTTDILNRFKKWNGKSLIEIDGADTSIKDFSVATKELDNGDVITNLVVDWTKESIAFPLSKAFAEDVTADPDALLDGEFYLNNKRKVDDDGNPLEGEDENPTGDLYMSFGKPSGLSFDSKTSLVSAETVAKED